VYEIVLECKGVSHWFGDKQVLYDVNLKVARGQIVALVGPSGCGKSTLLRAILGTHPAKEGQVLMNGQAVSEPGRDRGIVYQRYSLFPFLTAVENVAFGLMLDQTSLPFRAFRFRKWWGLKKQHLAEAADLLNRFKLGNHLRSYPTQLSGGMCQRVAIAQAMIMKPEILLLDEPFGALDEATREEQQEMLLEFYQENLKARREGKKAPHTIIIVTHELNEALYVSDRVIALSQFWKWETTGLPQSPGSTLVYDAVGPPMPRDMVNRGEEFRKQRDELREAAFEEKIRHPREKFVRFWQEIEAGKGVGVMAPAQRG
jgi:NitT/TauT family transport system ATP-binding protein